MKCKFFIIIGLMLMIMSVNFVLAAPYSINFDVRNMAGFSDGVINANDITAYIQTRNPSSPMLSEANIAQNFINNGKSNSVNPAFLIATAKLEGQFGTAGWAAKYPNCHNTMGYGIPSGSTLPNSVNCVNTWGDMNYKVAYNIAYGSYYYKAGKYTVDQIRKVYAGNPNSQSIADIMNDLYSFAQSRHCINQCSSGQTQCYGYYKQSCIYSNGCYIWGNNVYCNSGCSYGQCLGTCTPKTCSQLGKNCGAWDNGCSQSINCGSCSSGQTCNNGACSGLCTNQCSSGQYRCNGYYSQSCIYRNGCWIFGGDSYCNNGCRGNGICNTCVPNSKWCDGNYVQTCNSDGSGSNGVMCPSGQTCSNGQCSGSSNCPNCQSLNYKCGSFGFSNGCPSINCGDCPYPQYCKTTSTGSGCVNS